MVRWLAGRLAPGLSHSVVRSCDLFFVLGVQSMPAGPAVQLLSQALVLVHECSQLVGELAVLVREHSHVACQRVSFTVLVVVLIAKRVVESPGTLVVVGCAVQCSTEFLEFAVSRRDVAMSLGVSLSHAVKLLSKVNVLVGHLVVAGVQAVNVVVQFGVAITASGQLTLAVVEALLDGVDVVILMSDVAAQLIAAVRFTIDLVVQLLEALFLVVLVDVETVLVISQRREITALLGTVSLKGFNFLVQEAESLSQLFNFMAFDVRVFASFVSIKALFSQKCLGSLKLVVNCQMLSHFLVV